MQHKRSSLTARQCYVCSAVFFKYNIAFLLMICSWPCIKFCNMHFVIFQQQYKLAFNLTSVASLWFFNSWNGLFGLCYMLLVENLICVWLAVVEFFNDVSSRACYSKWFSTVASNAKGPSSWWGLPCSYAWQTTKILSLEWHSACSMSVSMFFKEL